MQFADIIPYRYKFTYATCKTFIFFHTSAVFNILKMQSTNINDHALKYSLSYGQYCQNNL